MREARVDFQRAVFQQFGGQYPGIFMGDDLVVVTVHDQNGDLDALQVFGEIGLGKRHDPVIVRLGTAHHALPPPVQDDALGRLGAWAVIAVERSSGNVLVELCPVGFQLRLQAVEH